MEKGPISQFITHHYRHFNSAALVDAAKAYEDLLNKGGKGKVYFGVSNDGEILGLKGHEKAASSYVASARTAEYYKTRPCAAKVESAARIFANYLKAKGC